MSTPLPLSVVQFLDENGKPYAGGSIAFFEPGTSSPKTTYSDRLGAFPNSNPVVLDAAGRAVIFGDAVYRAVLTDKDGNLIWDKIAASYLDSSVISGLMLPVVGAASLSDARHQMGVDTAISDAINAISLLAGSVGPTGPAGATGAVGATGPTGPVGPAAFVPNPNGSLKFYDFLMQWGSGASNGRITFPGAFPHTCLQVVVSVLIPTTSVTLALTGWDSAGFSTICLGSQKLDTQSCTVTYIAVGW